MRPIKVISNLTRSHKWKALFPIILFVNLAVPVMGQTTHTLNLKESIQYGLSNHASVRIYENNVRKSQQAAREALSAYMPQVIVSGGLDDNLKLPKTIIPAGTFGPGTPEQRVSFGSQFNSTIIGQVDQKIYDQSALTGLKARQPNIDLAAVQKEQNNEDLIFNIASSYYQILVAQKQLELLNNNKEKFEKILTVTKLQAAQGVIKKVDIKQVQVNLNNVIAQISVVENNLTLAKNTLKNNIGLPQKDSLVLTDTARWLGEKPLLKEMPEFDYSRSLDYQLQKIQISLYDINRKVIRDQAFPTLGFYARYGANGFGEKLEKAFDPLLDFSTIGVKISWNLFSGFRRDAQYKQASLDLQNARINLSLNAENQDLYFQNAKAKVKRSQITISTNKENMDLATEVYENTSLQYREGLASLSDLLNAELSYREAQNNYINSLLDYYLADLDVQKTNGTLENYFKDL